MQRLSGYGPSLIVLVTLALLLLAGPFAVRQLTWHQTRARIQLASERLDENPVLERLNDAYRDLAAFVEPSVVHISTERDVRDRSGTERKITSSGSGWVYDASGQPLTATFLDYAMPRAHHARHFDMTTDEGTPSTNNHLGVKGVGELGTIGAAPAVANAVLDALARAYPHMAVDRLQMPFTAERVWKAIETEAR